MIRVRVRSKRFRSINKGEREIKGEKTRESMRCHHVREAKEEFAFRDGEEANSKLSLFGEHIHYTMKINRGIGINFANSCCSFQLFFAACPAPSVCALTKTPIANRKTVKVGN